jgi:hypothetical protein
MTQKGLFTAAAAADDDDDDDDDDEENDGLYYLSDNLVTFPQTLRLNM